MAENKAVDNVKRLEGELAAARESARTGYLKTITEAVENLKAIGFDYEVKENGTPTKRLGRPRKEAAHGQTAQVV